MATRKLGVGRVQKPKDIKEKYQNTAYEFADKKLENFSEQLKIFTQKLEEFSSKHRDEIRKNPEFRRSFQEMCVNAGVDPLASSKGFWSEKLGFGDFYYELAIQIIEICLSKNSINGGLTTLDELKRCLLRSRSKTRKESITTDDIIRAVRKLEVLGNGFELLKLKGGKYLVQSVPGELNKDSIQILQLAQEIGGYVNYEIISSQLSWDEQRIDRALECLIRDERIWVDNQSQGAAQYWFPLLFLKQSRNVDESHKNPSF